MAFMDNTMTVIYIYFTFKYAKCSYNELISMDENLISVGGQDSRPLSPLFSSLCSFSEQPIISRLNA